MFILTIFRYLFICSTIIFALSCSQNETCLHKNCIQNKSLESDLNYFDFSNQDNLVLPNEEEIKSSQYNDVMCAVVLNNKKNAISSKIFCDPRHKDQVCNFGPNFPKLLCNNTSNVWYQLALDHASELHNNKTFENPTVLLSSGTLKIKNLFPSHWPFNDYVAMHLKEGVNIEGFSYESYSSRIRLSDSDLIDYESSKKLDSKLTIAAFILAAKNRKGSNSGDSVLDKSKENKIKNLVFSGHQFGDLNCTSSPESEIKVRSAILAAGINQLNISQVTATHFLGNIFELGLFLQWVKEDPNCLGLSCLGMRFNIEGTKNNPSLIQNNKICDGKFGGIVAVGKHIKIEKNEILKIHKTWDTSKTGYGLTMGISASFAGTNNIEVLDNYIDGGDYGIGTDGSFPLALSLDLFKQYSSEISRILGSSIMKKYPNGIVYNNLVQLEGNDFVRGQQVLFDLASKSSITRSDESGYGFGINIKNNRISNSVAGIGFYRIKDSLINNNIISNEDKLKNYAGISLISSYQNQIFNNEISNWNKGIFLTGKPNSGTSKLGAAKNSIGSMPGRISEDGKWKDVGNTFRNNRIGIHADKTGIDNTFRKNVFINENNNYVKCSFNSLLYSDNSMDYNKENSDSSCNQY